MNPGHYMSGHHGTYLASAAGSTSSKERAVKTHGLISALALSCMTLIPTVSFAKGPVAVTASKRQYPNQVFRDGIVSQLAGGYVVEGNVPPITDVTHLRVRTYHNVKGRATGGTFRGLATQAGFTVQLHGRWYVDDPAVIDSLRILRVPPDAPAPQR
jgi:hypothetical protein